MALVLLTVTFAVFFIGMPRYVDDLWYSQHLKPWLEGVSGASLWQAVKETWVEHITTDNVRLANMVCVLFLTVPKWIGSGLSALLWGISMVWGARLAGLETRRLTPLLALCLCLWTFFMPWYDSLGAENYQFNYIWATFLSVGVLRLFFSRRKRSCALLFIAGLIAGMWHEGFTAPLFAALFTLLVFYPSLRSRRSLWLLVGVFVGLVWMLAWPTSWHRASDVTGDNEFGLGRVVFISFQHPAVVLMLLTCCVALCRSKWRRLFADKLTVGLLVCVFVSLAIHFVTTRTPRTGWWAEYCSVIVTVSLLRRICPGLTRGGSSLNIMLAALLLTLTFVRQAFVDYYTVQVSRSYGKAVRAHLASGSDFVFAEVPTEHDTPLICLYAPDFTLLLAPVNLMFVDSYYSGDKSGRFIPVPEQLRNVTADSGNAVPPLPGGIDLHIRELDGRLFMPIGETDRGEFSADVDFGYTCKHGVRMLYFPFVSEADGHRYAYLYPWRRVVEMRFGSVKAVSPADSL